MVDPDQETLSVYPQIHKWSFGRAGGCNFYQEGRVWLSTTSNGDNVDLWSDNEKDKNQMWRITCLEDDA